MKRGRPTIYNEKLVEEARKYVDGGWQEAGDPVPSVAGLACEIGVNRETLRLWSKDESNDFFGILNEIMQIQERSLLKGGLQGDFNPSITKMMMTKHGYSDRVEQDLTTSDGSMRPTTVVIKAADERS
jgi:hypothetical protein